MKAILVASVLFAALLHSAISFTPQRNVQRLWKIQQNALVDLSLPGNNARAKSHTALQMATVGGYGSKVYSKPKPELWEDEDFQWYILQTQNTFEEWCMKTITKKLELEGLTDQVAEMVVPKYKSASMTGKFTKVQDKPLFPTYLYVRMKMSEPLWDLLVTTQRVVNFVGEDEGGLNARGTHLTGRRGAVTPVALDEDEVGRLQESLGFAAQQEEDCAKMQRLELGTVVQVDTADVEGQLYHNAVGAVRAIEDNLVVVRISIYGSPIEVSLPVGNLRVMSDEEVLEGNMQREAERDGRHINEIKRKYGMDVPLADDECLYLESPMRGVIKPGYKWGDFWRWSRARKEAARADRPEQQAYKRRNQFDSDRRPTQRNVRFAAPTTSVVEDVADLSSYEADDAFFSGLDDLLAGVGGSSSAPAAAVAAPSPIEEEEEVAGLAEGEQAFFADLLGGLEAQEGSGGGGSGGGGGGGDAGFLAELDDLLVAGGAAEGPGAGAAAAAGSAAAAAAGLDLSFAAGLEGALEDADVAGVLRELDLAAPPAPAPAPAKKQGKAAAAAAAAVGEEGGAAAAAAAAAAAGQKGASLDDLLEGLDLDSVGDEELAQLMATLAAEEEAAAAAAGGRGGGGGGGGGLLDGPSLEELAALEGLDVGDADDLGDEELARLLGSLGGGGGGGGGGGMAEEDGGGRGASGRRGGGARLGLGLAEDEEEEEDHMGDLDDLDEEEDEGMGMGGMDMAGLGDLLGEEGGEGFAVVGGDGGGGRRRRRRGGGDDDDDGDLGVGEEEGDDALAAMMASAGLGMDEDAMAAMMASLEGAASWEEDEEGYGGEGEGEDAFLGGGRGAGIIGEEEPSAVAAPPSAAAAPSSGGGLTRAALEGMKVPELKEALKARGLKVGGKKAELAARLAEAEGL